MKNIYHFLSFFLFVALYFSQVQSAIFTADRIVAIVNENAITHIELDKKIASIKNNLARRHITAPPSDVLEKQVLEKMITESVLTQYAHRIGITVDDKVLDLSIHEMAKKKGYSVSDLKKQIEQEGIDWKEFQEEVQQNILIAYLREREVNSKISVTDKEVNHYLNQIGDTPEMEYELAHIVVPIPENASAEQVTAKGMRIKAAKAEIDRGQPFPTVAAAYSSAPDATNGGYIGWRIAGSLPPVLLEQINSLSPGQITAIIRTPSFFILIQLLNKRNSSNQTIVHQIHARHILIRPNELISEDEAKKKLNLIRKRLLNGEKFEDLARLYSDDLSASRGGDLGWLSPGETVPEFEQTMQQLSTQSETDAVSQPVKTDLGVHLIQILGQRDQDMTGEQRKIKVHMELLQRKSDALFEDWVSQLRDSAHVEIRLNDE